MTGLAIQFLKAGFVLDNKSRALAALLIGDQVALVILPDADLTCGAGLIGLVARRARVALRANRPWLSQSKLLEQLRHHRHAIGNAAP